MSGSVQHGALREQALQHHGELIGGAHGIGGDAPVLDHINPVREMTVERVASSPAAIPAVQTEVAR
jgi:hypothetical protein